MSLMAATHQLEHDMVRAQEGQATQDWFETITQHIRHFPFGRNTDVSTLSKVGEQLGNSLLLLQKEIEAKQRS